ncbi:MAG: hypothetical protein HY645_08085 [Acidobacteria bacterium]|nr:hypothetical protein [Acidobacteriota bacterium]
MRFAIRSAVFLCFICFFANLDAQVYRSRAAQPFWDYKTTEISLDDVSLELLLAHASRRNPGISEKELQDRVASNFRFILFNSLNKKNFLISPDPQTVVEKSVAVLELHEQLTGLLEEGRRLVRHDGSAEKKEELVARIGETARGLRQTFRHYFLDSHPMSYVMHFYVFGNERAQFVHFLIQTEKVNRMLARELDHYFFNPAPGSVELSEFSSFSIPALSESIAKLSDLTRKKLRP